MFLPSLQKENVTPSPGGGGIKHWEPFMYFLSYGISLLLVTINRPPCFTFLLPFLRLLPVPGKDLFLPCKRQTVRDTTEQHDELLIFGNHLVPEHMATCSDSMHFIECNVDKDKNVQYRII